MYFSPSSSPPLDECGSVCFSAKLPTGTTLSDCVLSFHGTVENKWYAITLQVRGCNLFSHLFSAFLIRNNYL